jgi:Rubisco LSMT substrate-binding
MIDMANHQSQQSTGEVAFEFFGNAYSLAVATAPKPDDASSSTRQQLYISYGPRSNDQLLQYYGFVEEDNPHDVYIMPSLRSWDIAALESTLGRPFAPGRLEKLDRAGLLGSSEAMGAADNEVDDSLSAANINGGVVINRVQGLDPAVLQALRALVSTDAEWDAAGQAIGNFCLENSGGVENEQRARLVARTAIALELSSKATTIQQDQELLRRLESSKGLDASPSERLAIQFRIEKKKLLQEAIEMLK